LFEALFFRDERFRFIKFDALFNFLHTLLSCRVNLRLQLWIRHEVLSVLGPPLLRKVQLGKSILLHAHCLGSQTNHKLSNFFLVGLIVSSLQQSSSFGNMGRIERLLHLKSLLQEGHVDFDVGI
jgi:hypothetical protein